MKKAEGSGRWGRELWPWPWRAVLDTACLGVLVEFDMSWAGLRQAVGDVVAGVAL